MVSFQHVIDVNALLLNYFAFFSPIRPSEATALVLLTVPAGPVAPARQPTAALALPAAEVADSLSVA